MSTVHSRRPRPRGLRVLVGIGSMAAVCGLVAACGASADDDSDPEHRSFALPGRTLTIDSDDSSLEVVVADGTDGTDAKKVRVTRWFDGRTVFGSDPEISWGMDGDRLSFRMKCRGVISSCSAKHRVVVPRGVAVTVLSADGPVTARGFDAPLKVRSADGSVTVKDVGGPLDLRSQDGSVNAVGITSKQVSASSADGSLRLDLRAVPDRVRARTQDGSVTIGLPVREGGAAAGGRGSAAYRVDARSVDGGVDVSVPRDGRSRHHVSVSSADGGITVRAAN
ncbi:DUF4097 family beta strand repeat-containing protein [Streptomyces sp. G45]|uniref:DUF4097 family beta strand repeat-containing protein n=1 Tax=Streptomyces sp. G45 TaxID=3406627 RepID=UPI003C1DDA71